MSNNSDNAKKQRPFERPLFFIIFVKKAEFYLAMILMHLAQFFIFLPLIKLLNFQLKIKSLKIV